MCIVLTTSPELKISLDLVRTEDRVPSVAFNLLVEVNMPFQQSRVSANECWFKHEALNRFEDQLADLRSTEGGTATLSDMSDRPVLRVIRVGNEIKTTVRTTDTMQMETTVVEVHGYASEIAVLWEQLRSYEKWW